MNEEPRIILCVDDEENILNAIRRLLRRDGYRILTTTDAAEGLRLIAENPVGLVIADQRMPHMSGAEFLARVKDNFPDIIRIILTGYTDVDTITQAVNRGLIYKFLLKPWNDEDFKLDIRQAFEQHALVRLNRELQQKVMTQNEDLRRINEDLEEIVCRRTQELEMLVQSLELAQAILEDVPVPVVGISAEGTVVLINGETARLPGLGSEILLGRELAEIFPEETAARILGRIEKPGSVCLRGCQTRWGTFDVFIASLSGRFQGRGIVMCMQSSGRSEHEPGIFRSR